MVKFEDSKWSKSNSAKEFIQDSDSYIQNRKQLFMILKSFYKFNLLPNLENNPINIMDLGCGDGRVTHELLEVDKSLSGTLVDGSEEMLKIAKNRFKSYTQFKYFLSTFQELMTRDVLPVNFDFIVSSLAIHHLSFKDKEKFFEYIYGHLKPGGYFLNIDVIKAPNEVLEEWYLTLWKEWILENELNKDSSFINVPDMYKNNPDNHPDQLVDQLNALGSVGFKNVDCYYKYGIFAIYGGQKSV